MSTNLRFTGGSRSGNATTIGSSQLTGTTYTNGAVAESYGVETERDGKHPTIQEAEIGSSRTSGHNDRPDS
jgi:hypothetical protein